MQVLRNCDWRLPRIRGGVPLILLAHKAETIRTYLRDQNQKSGSNLRGRRILFPPFDIAFVAYTRQCSQFGQLSPKLARRGYGFVDGGDYRKQPKLCWTKL